MTVSKEQGNDLVTCKTGYIPDSADSKISASVEATTAALGWLASQRPQTPRITVRDPTAPIKYASPALIYCTSEAGTLLMAGLWAPTETETSHTLARAAKTLHRLWRREAKYRTLWACASAPHRLERWASERSRALATAAITDPNIAPPTPLTHCPICLEALSDALPTADKHSTSASMFACPSRFPGHTFCRDCETASYGHPSGSKCPLCRAPRFQSLMG